MKKLIAIYGINGAGKTSLVNNILMSDFATKSDGDFLFDCFNFFEKKSPYGTYVVSKNGKYIAVGSYHGKCGGADTIKNVDDYFNIIEYLADNYPSASLCVEGVIQKATDRLINLFETLQKKGYTICIINLNISLDRAIDHVKNRSGRIPNAELMLKKVSATGGLFKKLQDCGKFNCYVINVDNKTQEMVYEEFKRIILNVGQGNAPTSEVET